MQRRAFLGSAASTLLLPGCATVATRGAAAASAAGCLSKVDVAAERVIRSVAGLRPYRRAGFVVRAEALGAKRLVHNYGHGGGGITLSWGTSKLALELGLPGHAGAVAVLGCGVVGLATARLVQEAGFAVTLYASALPPDTTSNVAGGQFDPYAVGSDEAFTPAFREQFTRALDYSWRRYQIMVGDDYGIRWLPTYVERDGAEEKLLPTFPAAGRVLRPAEHPFPWTGAYRYDTLYVEAGRYLRQMMRDVQIAGGRIEVRRFATADDVAALPETLVFNCTGLGSRELFGDTELRPARGQLAILEPQPEVRYAFNSSSGYMFPRADGILLGGSFELDQWSTDPDPKRIARILAAHQRLFAGFRCAA